MFYLLRASLREAQLWESIGRLFSEARSLTWPCFSVFERMVTKVYIWGSTCLHGLAQREGSGSTDSFLSFYFFYFLVAEEKGSGRTYDTTDG